MFGGDIYSRCKRPLSYPKDSWPSTFPTLGIPLSSTWLVPRASKIQLIYKIRKIQVLLFNSFRLFLIFSTTDFVFIWICNLVEKIYNSSRFTNTMCIVLCSFEFFFCESPLQLMLMVDAGF